MAKRATDPPYLANFLPIDKRSTLKNVISERHPNLFKTAKRLLKRGDSHKEYIIEYAMIADEQVKAIHKNSDTDTATYLLLVAHIVSITYIFIHFLEYIPL